MFLKEENGNIVFQVRNFRAVEADGLNGAGSVYFFFFFFKHKTEISDYSHFTLKRHPVKARPS